MSSFDFFKKLTLLYNSFKHTVIIQFFQTSMYFSEGRLKDRIFCLVLHFEFSVRLSISSNVYSIVYQSLAMCIIVYQSLAMCSIVYQSLAMCSIVYQSLYKL